MSMNITYRRRGDYLLPNLSAPESPEIDIWGERRRRFLREHKRGIYSGMLLSGKLNTHLEEIDRQGEQMFSQLVREIVTKEGITETLKAIDQMAWVGVMNNIRTRAEKIVLHELIFC